MPTPYVLVATLGKSPAVLTETVWSLFTTKGRLPAEVHLITTSVGWSNVRKHLLTPAGLSPWARLCRGVLGLDHEVPIRRLPLRDSDGRVLRDIRDQTDDLAFGAACYALVQRLTASDDLPHVVGSIAGGRKTMSAHLMTAFSLSARPRDELVHVLVQPEHYEWTPGVFFPGPDVPDMRVHRVDLPFPRVRAVLEEKFVARLGGRYDLPSLLRELDAHNSIVVPHCVRVSLGVGPRGTSRIELVNAEGDVLGEPVSFPARATAVFLTVIEALASSAGGPPGAVRLVANTSGEHKDAGYLIANPHLAACMRAAYAWAGETHPDLRGARRKPEQGAGMWTSASEVSKMIALVNKELDAPGVHPLLRKHLCFDAVKGSALRQRYPDRGLKPQTLYRHWASFQDLPVEVVEQPEGPPGAAAPWPFQHVPRPVRAPHAPAPPATPPGGRDR